MNAKPKKREPSIVHMKYRQTDDKVWTVKKQATWDNESKEIVQSLARKYSTPYELQKMREKGLIGA